MKYWALGYVFEGALGHHVQYEALYFGILFRVGHSVLTRGIGAGHLVKYGALGHPEHYGALGHPVQYG